MGRHLLLALFFTAVAMPFCANAKIVSAAAGRVGDEILTSREVLVSHLLEQALFEARMAPKLKPEDIKSREFIREATGALVETAVFLEAKSFAAVEISKETFDSEKRRVVRKLSEHRYWRELQVTPEELDAILARKLRAKKFIQFKIDSSNIVVTDQDAEEYFQQNRLRFENLPFAQFKQNIKKFLVKQQMDRRLKDWFELLQAKYKVRNFLAE